MWGVLSLVRQGLRRRRRRTARVVDESALGDGAAGDAGADVTTVFRDGDARAAAPRGPSALARALLAMACAVRLDGEDVGGADEAWASTGWRPRADEVSHLMMRESMRYAIYA